MLCVMCCMLWDLDIEERFELVRSGEICVYYSSFWKFRTSFVFFSICFPFFFWNSGGVRGYNNYKMLKKKKNTLLVYPN